MKSVDSQIEECIAANQSFVLDAGAGAGKTYSLVQTLKHLMASKERGLRQTGQQIACVTFTNVAKDQIIERIGPTPIVRVSTIHDFLWDVSKGHQKALKAALLKFNDTLKDGSARKVVRAELQAALPHCAVSYSDRGSKLAEGRLFHDDLLGVAEIMFRDNPLLCRLVAAKHPYVLIDEYQDTARKVINAFLGSVLPQNEGVVVFGFFGDKFQNIYHGGENPGVGEIPPELTGKLRFVPKGDNRRCSIAVINLLNQIRTDIQQFPADKNVAGDAVYIQLTAPTSEEGLVRAREFTKTTRDWKLDGVRVRELYLTHRLIARSGGYALLLEAYQARGSFFRDQLISGEESVIAFFIEKIEPLVATWAAGQVGATISTLRKVGHKIIDNAAKRTTREALERLVELRRSATVREVLEHLQSTAIAQLPDSLHDRLNGVVPSRPEAAPPEWDEREAREAAFFAALLNLPYQQVADYVSFFREHTPFATKHGVKGDEFDVVYVVLDDQGANWNLYSFEKYLTREDETKNQERFKRSRNVFYVCCSRAKQNLCVIDLGSANAKKQERAIALFGKENCFAL